LIALALFTPLAEKIAIAEPSKQIVCVFNQARNFDPQELEDNLSYSSYRKTGKSNQPNTEKKSEIEGTLKSCSNTGLEYIRQ